MTLAQMVFDLVVGRMGSSKKLRQVAQFLSLDFGVIGGRYRSALGKISLLA